MLTSLGVLVNASSATTRSTTCPITGRTIWRRCRSMLPRSIPRIPGSAALSAAMNTAPISCVGAADRSALSTRTLLRGTLRAPIAPVPRWRVPSLLRRLPR